MYVVESYSTAVVLCLLTMLCWGSWANTQKAVSKAWRFELFYWDYVAGVLLVTLAIAFTIGSTGATGRGFLATCGTPSIAEQFLAEDLGDDRVVLARHGSRRDPRLVVEAGIRQLLVELLVYHVEIVDLGGKLRTLILSKVDPGVGHVADELFQTAADVDVELPEIAGGANLRSASVVADPELLVRLDHPPGHANG